jgi:hypothetical protein
MADTAQIPVLEADHHAAKTYVCVTVALLAVAFATLIARIIFKIRLRLLFTLDDYLIVVGAV